ncbi:uncharacterized protein CEXT_724701 [Caerostris extrusa]|uniref:Uncharacterized protein n=1 Tax=Caerostris extrusa TaxID=172846 RepID=A0AAV4QQZ0_CAEEX|nr:uncharacterized protein CEXT_724701 [Caerostris extrusa]
MEKRDSSAFPYTGFYQEIEFHEELLVAPTDVHIEPARTADVTMLYNFIVPSVSDFILVSFTEMVNMLRFYALLKSSTEELEKDLKEPSATKNQDLFKVKRELIDTMKSKFIHIIDLDLLQDTMENPHYYIKKAQFTIELDNMRQDLKKLKEDEALALRDLDQLRFEDTKICYELLELRREFKFLNDSYSTRCEVLPKIGEVREPDEELQDGDKSEDGQ